MCLVVVIVVCVCACVCRYVHEFGGPWQPEALDPPEVPGCCEWPDMSVGNQIRLPVKAAAFIASEPSFQRPPRCFKQKLQIMYNIMCYVNDCEAIS